MNRAGERGDIPQRDERFIEQQQRWFFKTREGAIEGPFESRTQAAKALLEFLEFLASATPRMQL